MMKKIYTHFSRALYSAVFLLFSVASWGQVWTYDFGSGTGTTSAGANTTTFFSTTVTPVTAPPAGGGTYRVRVGSAAGAQTVANPGTSLGTNSELQMKASSSTSTNKFTVFDWASPSTVAYVKAKIRTTSTANGNLNFSLGVNTLGSDNQNYTNQYNNSLVSFTIAYTSGAISSVVRCITGPSNTTITSSGFTKDTDQYIEVYANNDAASKTYSRSGSTYTLATRTWDLWVGGTKVVTGGTTAGTLSAGINLSGFGFFAENSTGNVAYIYLDDLEYSNALPVATNTIDWCNLQWPDSGSITEGGTYTVYARDNEPGVTTVNTNTQPANISAWIGVSPVGAPASSDPATWTTWIPATTWSDLTSPDQNNDEYSVNIATGLTPGTYRYASRFQIDGGAYRYGGYNATGGGFWDGTTNVSGTLTVASNVADSGQVTPASGGPITVGSAYNAYLEFYKSGFTETAGQSTPIPIVEFGYNSTNANAVSGTGWTWITASFDPSTTGNNDKYLADIGTGRAVGTYYYAARIRMQGSTEYRYFGTSSFAYWNNDNGTFTVNPDVVDGGAISLAPTSVPEGTASTATVEIYEPGLTNPAGQGSGVTVQIAYNTSNTNPDTWPVGSWTNASYTVDSGNNDVYSLVLPNNLTPGTYYVAARAIKSGSSAHQYFGTTFDTWSSNNAQLTVTSNLVDFANIQDPKHDQTIEQGSAIDVFAHIRINGVTDVLPDNPATGVSAWIGYSTTAPTSNASFTSGWTWVPAAYNAAYPSSGSYISDDDEYWVQNFGQTAGNTFTNTPGVYYFVSRFQKSGSTEYVYGGSDDTDNNISGGIWNGTTYTERKITVQAKQEIDVLGNGISIVNNDVTPSLNDHTDFGSVALDYNSVQTYTIKNLGEVGLTVSGVSISGTNAADFVVTTNPTSPVAGAGSTTFDITFTPSSLGLKTATVSIANNDDNENPYVFNIQGNGSRCAEVSEIVYAQQDFEGTTPLTNTAKWTGFIGGGSIDAAKIYVGNINAYGTTITTTESVSIDTQSLINNNRGGNNLTMNSFNASVASSNLSLTFRLGAFSTTPTNGLDGVDYVKVEVKGGTAAAWKEVLTVRGAGIATSNMSQSIWGYSATGTAQSSYNDASPTTFFAPGNATSSGPQLTPNGYSTVKITDIPNVDGIQIRITLDNNATAEVWAIDNIKLFSESSVTTKTWNGTWTGGAPTLKDKAVIDADYVTGTNGSFEACLCQVNSDKTLTISANTTTINNSATIKYDLDNQGNVVVKSDGTLLQISKDAVNTGSIKVEREVTDMDNDLPTRMDYVYWSSPVLGQGLQSFSPATPANRIFWYNEANDRFYGVNLTLEPNFLPAKGYAIRAEDKGSVTGYEAVDYYNKTYEFVGVPNNGDKDIEIKRSANTGSVVHGYNLVGNPYPSNIDFEELYLGNSDLIWNTAYFWTNNTYERNQLGSSYSGNNYAIYNGTGGNSATSPATGSGVTATPDGIIKVGQGFIVQKKGAENTTGTLQFKNSYGAGHDLRVAGMGTFFQRNTQPKNRFWLKLISPTEIVNSQLVGYVEGASDNYDQDYDAEAFSMSSDLFYSILEDKKLLVQGKSNAFVDTDIVPIGANFFQTGNYTIALDNPEGIFANGQAIYLKDNLLNTYTNLKEGNYTFNANAGITDGRFEIVYRPGSTLATDQSVKGDIIVYRDQNDFLVKSSDKKIEALDVYDASGRLIHQQIPKNKEVIIPNQILINGVYFIKVKSESGEITTKKIRK